MTEKYNHVTEARLNVAALIKAASEDDQDGIDTLIDLLDAEEMHDALVMMSYAIGVIGTVNGTVDTMISYLTGDDL